jgi:hypothetical protein
VVGALGLELHAKIAPGGLETDRRQPWTSIDSQATRKGRESRGWSAARRTGDTIRLGPGRAVIGRAVRTCDVADHLLVGAFDLGNR